MCQITAYLDGEVIMKDVLLVEPVPEGVLLTTFFEQPRIVPAVIRRLDLMKNRLLLESSSEHTESEKVDKSHSHSLANGVPGDDETG